MTRTTRDRRQFGRRRTAIHAMIVNDKGHRSACIVRNISIGGALLEIDNPALLPAYFTLQVEADGFAADCEIRHRTEHGVGVFFTEVRVARNGRDTRYLGPQPMRAPNSLPINQVIDRLNIQRLSQR